MIRRDFLRNSLMALAVSLLPKVLRPVEPELIESESPIFFYVTFNDGGHVWYNKETLDMWNAFEKKHNPFGFPILLP